MATTTDWTPADTEAARRIWQGYQTEHDLSGRIGQAAGIDPRTGEVWLGDSIVDIVDQRKAKGLSSPLFFERIGYPTYFRKGRRR